MFPLRPGTKLPLPNSDWTHTATADLAEVERIWTSAETGNSLNYNIGVLTSGLIVLDLDTKDGKDGIAQARSLGVDFDTLTVRTPTGGRHLYFTGPERANAVGIVDGVDVRSYNGYVVAPGSTRPDGTYTLEKDAQLLPLRAEIAARLSAPRHKTASAALPVVEQDQPAMVARALEYLATEAPSALEGGRNNALFKVACTVKDYGLSEAAAVSAIKEHWNTRLPTPLDAEEVEKAVGSAYKNGALPPGSGSMEHMVAGLRVPEPDPPASSGWAERFRHRPPREERQIPGRAWVATRLLHRKVVSVLAAPGGAGKSSLQLILAAHLAMGQSFGRYGIKQSCRTVIVNNEDSYDEMDMRLRAVCRAYQFPIEQVMQQVRLVSGDDGLFKLADGDRQQRFRADDMREFFAEVTKYGAAVVMIDPLMETHDTDISDNMGMKNIMAMYRTVARECNIAILLAHHTNKAARNDVRPGDVSAVMGASSIINSSRIAVTLFEATEDDRTRYGFSASDMRTYVRLDEAKANMAKLDSDPSWFRRDTIILDNGAEVGTLRRADPREAADKMRAGLLNELANIMSKMHVTTLTTFHAARELLKRDPLLVSGGYTDKTLKTHLEAELLNAFATEDGDKLCLESVMEDGTPKYKVVKT